jgi:plastocyanin
MEPSMFRQLVLISLALSTVACGDDSAIAPEQPPSLPSATEDRVGLPTNYATTLKPFYVYDRSDNRQVRVVYGNDAARAGQPYARGSILVMETWSTLQNAGVPVLDANGRYQKNALTGIFVMRKEKWFGLRYKEHQTGEWEYASYRPDLTPLVVGDAAAQQCAVCHLDAAPSRDWVYRGNIFYAGASGTLPQVPANQPADQPIISSYTFLPANITIKPGTRLTWTNNDQVKHTLTLDTGGFSGLMSQGASLGLTFNTVGTFRFLCAIHSTMRTTVVVAP